MRRIDDGPKQADRDSLDLTLRKLVSMGLKDEKQLSSFNKSVEKVEDSVITAANELASAVIKAEEEISKLKSSASGLR